MGEWLQKVAHNGILFSFLKKKKERKKERNSVICNNMDEPGHYAKWCKPDRERQIPHSITNMKKI